MGNPIEDYINGLEGKSDLDPLSIARDLRELSTQEIAARDAKIETLNGTVAERDGIISGLNADVTTWKAKNFDLAMQIPGADSKVPEVDENQNVKSGDSRITVSDLFNKSTRERHFRNGR